MLSSIRQRLRAVLLGRHQQVLGDPATLGSRILKYTIILSGMGAGAAIYFLLVQGLEAQADSYGRIAPIVRVATSTWSYVVLELLLLRGMLVITNSRKAHQAASYLGMEPETVQRFAAEAKSTEGTTRVICTSEDTEEEIRERLHAGMLEADDDVIRRDDPTAERAEERLENHYASVELELEQLETEYLELNSDIDRLLSDALEGHASLSELEGAAELLSLYDMMGADAQRSVDRAETLLGRSEEVEARIDERADVAGEARELRHAPERSVWEAAESAHALADALQGAGYTPRRESSQEPAEAPEIAVEGRSLLGALRPALAASGAAIGLWAVVDRLPGWILGGWSRLPESIQSAVPASTRQSAGAWLTEAAAREISIIFPLAVACLALLIGVAGYGYSRLRSTREVRSGSRDSDESTEDALPWEARFKLWRMDTAASLQTGDLLWQFAVPAALTFGGLVVVAGIWLQWWAYPLLLSGGVFVGAANYARISMTRERELRALQRDDSAEAWDACSVLVKNVESGPATMAYAWFEGNGHAHENARELADHLAPRVQQLLHGEEPDPSVCRKYYRNVRDMYPDLKGWRENVEEHKISNRLIEATESSPDGIIPRDKLIEDVVLHDREPGLLGLYQTGLGHDPELVRECYRELVPVGLVEEDMEIESSSGEIHTVTAVRSRMDPLPAELSEVRANFASRFRAYAQWEPLFEPPEVDLSTEELLVQPGTAPTTTERET